MVRQTRVTAETERNDRDNGEARASSEMDESAAETLPKPGDDGPDDWSFTDWAAI